MYDLLGFILRIAPNLHHAKYVYFQTFVKFKIEIGILSVGQRALKNPLDQACILEMIMQFLSRKSPFFQQCDSETT